MYDKIFTFDNYIASRFQADSKSLYMYSDMERNSNKKLMQVYSLVFTV